MLAHVGKAILYRQALAIIESYTYTLVGVLCRITADRGYSQASQSAISVNKNSMTKLAFVTCMCK